MLTSLLHMLHGKSPADIVWTADISYWLAARQQDGTADPAWATEDGFLRLHRELGIMPYYYYPTFSSYAVHFDDTVVQTQEQQGHGTRSRLSTPIGEVMMESVFLPESCCYGITKHYIETEADLDILRYLIDHRRLEPANLETYPDRLAYWAAYDGLPGLGLPRSPLPAFIYEWVGIENAVYLLADAESAVRDLLAVMEAQEAPVIDAVCAIAPPLVHFPDNLSSDNLTGVFDDYMAAPYQRRLAQLHAAGVTCAVHLDGAVRGLLPRLAAIGLDAIEALTPRPCGDADLIEMRALAGDARTVLWGGLPGAMFAPPYSWDDLRAHLEQLLAAWHGIPFVIGVADQVPPDGDISFCRRISDLLRDAQERI